MVLDRVRRFLGLETEQTQSEETPFQGVGTLPPIVVSYSGDLIEVTTVPEKRVRAVWGLIEKDSALSYLTPEEKALLEVKASIIARLATSIIPETDLPELQAMIYKSIEDWIDQENIELLASLRLSRSVHGFERRMSTITAPREALGW